MSAHANKSKIGVCVNNSGSYGSSTIIGDAIDDLDISWVGLGIPYNLSAPTSFPTTNNRYNDVYYAKYTRGIGTHVGFEIPTDPTDVYTAPDTWDDYESDWKTHVGDWLDCFLNHSCVPDYVSVGNEPNATGFWEGTYAQYADLCTWTIEVVATFNSENSQSVKVLVGCLAGIDGSGYGGEGDSWWSWAEDLNDDFAGTAAGISAHFYEGTASAVTSKMCFLKNTSAPDFDEYWLGETNLCLWYGDGDYYGTGNPAPDYDATDADILEFFEDIIDAAGNWTGTLFYDYYGHRFDRMCGDGPGPDYPRFDACGGMTGHDCGADSPECFGIREHTTIEEGIYNKLNGL
jgi:hypothetical protein